MSDMRFVQNMALMAAIQPVQGVPVTTFGATDAVLLVEPARVRAEPVNIDRKLVRPYWGASEQIQGTILMKLNFKVELGMSPAPGVAPAIGRLLRACAFAETITASTSVAYTPVSQQTEMLTFRFFQDGVRYVTHSARGKCKILLNAYEVPMVDFEFWGIGRDPLVAALPTTDFTGSVRPTAVSAKWSSDFRLGVTLGGGGGTGGTSYPCKGLEIDVANDLNHYLNTAQEEVGIASRRITGKTTVLLDEAQEVAWYTDIADLVTTTASFGHGSASGRQVWATGPKVQRAFMDRVEDKGRVNFATDLVYMPNAGNDDLRLLFV